MDNIIMTIVFTTLVILTVSGLWRSLKSKNWLGMWLGVLLTFTLGGWIGLWIEGAVFTQSMIG